MADPERFTVTSRAELVANAAESATVARSKGSQRTRDGRRLVMTAQPVLIENLAGKVIGVECRVRLYDEAGVEVPIDPVRRFVNPPTVHDGVTDPLAALWSILWDSIDVAPAPDAWVP
jgi:hypothetical protein